MSQYSLSTTDPLRKGSREQPRKIRLPWRADNGARKQRRYDLGLGEPSLIFDAGSIDTKASRANSRVQTVWSGGHTHDAGDDLKTPTQDKFGATVFGGGIFESPPVSRAGTADSTGMRARLSGEHRRNSHMSSRPPTFLKSPRGWKIPSPLLAPATQTFKGPSDADARRDCETQSQQQPVTPTTPSALTRVFGVFSRAMNR